VVRRPDSFTAAADLRLAMARTRSKLTEGQRAAFRHELAQLEDLFNRLEEQRARWIRRRCAFAVARFLEISLAVGLAWHFSGFELAVVVGLVSLYTKPD